MLRLFLVFGAAWQAHALVAPRAATRTRATTRRDASSGSLADGRAFTVCADEAEVSAYIAATVAKVAARAVAEKGAFSISIGSGTTVEPLRRLAENVDFSKWHVFFGNERCEGETAWKCADGAAFLAELVPASQFHRVPKGSAASAAAAYEATLRAMPADVVGRSATSGLPALDLVLLGSGADGHTASLYPGSPQALLRGETAVAVAEGKGGVTFTLPMISAARKVVVSATKPSQSEMVRDALLSAPSPETSPVGCIRGCDVEWLLSPQSAAAFLLEQRGAVVVGSSDYLKGFLESPIVDGVDLERDPNGGLDQALKLGAGATVLLGALFLGFMKSNGLL